MVGIVDVAARAGVSPATVSKVLNRPDTVPERTRQRVELAIKEMGYVRNASAHQLRAGRSRSIGLVVHHIANPFFTEVASGVEHAASAIGSIVILCDSAQSAQREDLYLRTLEEQRVQGVLIFPLQRNLAYLEQLHTRGITVVLMSQPEEAVNLSWVSVDDVRGGELAATHLFEQGHQTLTFIHGPMSWRQCVDRRRGIERVIARGHGDVQRALREVTTRDHTIADGKAAVETLLAMNPRPTAVFCANDLLALGVLSELSKRHIRVPDDIAIVGYDDLEYACASIPTLTTIRQPKYELGQIATKLLLEEAASTATPHRQHIMCQPELVVRESSVSGT